MKTRVIRVILYEEPELYEALLSATMNHIPYEGCQVMQYSERRDREGQMVGEFTMREEDTNY